MSPYVTLSAEGPGAEFTFALHVPSDEVRARLARHRYNVVLDGDEAVVERLNGVLG
jgi:hypothetical protein